MGLIFHLLMLKPICHHTKVNGDATGVVDSVNSPLPKETPRKKSEFISKALKTDKPHEPTNAKSLQTLL